MKFEYLVVEYENSVSREDLEGELDTCGYESWGVVKVRTGGKVRRVRCRRGVRLE